MSLPQVRLVTGAPQRAGVSGRPLPAPRPWPAAAHSWGRPTGPACPPLTALLWPSARVPGDTHLQTSHTRQLWEVQSEDPERRLPSRERQPATPQKETWFPSVSLQANGSPAAAPIPSNLGATHRPQDLGAWCQQRPGAGKPNSLLGSLALAEKVKLKKQVEKKKTTKKNNPTYQQHVSCLVHNSRVSSYCFW